MFGKTVNLVFGYGLMALLLVVILWLMSKMAEWRSKLFEKRYRLQTLFGSDDKK